MALLNNNLAIISSGWLTEMVSQAMRPENGAVGAKLYFDNGTIQHGGVILVLGPDGVAGHSHKGSPRNATGYFGRLMLRQNLSAVTAAYLVVQRSIYHEVGGLNQERLKVAFNDVDFGLKITAAGYRNLWTPYAEVYHYESISRGYEVTPEKHRRFETEKDYMYLQWGDSLAQDPYYNLNLTADVEGFSIAWPPRTDWG
ncbi:MAG TPA: hypothetical protein EYN66_21265 [Myxococcales bacterium]|nr:hypothetical protein [Myxococcales bacterium]